MPDLLSPAEVHYTPYGQKVSDDPDSPYYRQHPSIRFVPVDHDPFSGGPTQGPGGMPWYEKAGKAIGDVARGAGNIAKNIYEGASIVGMAQNALHAGALPGDVAQGKVDPGSPEGIARAADLAGFLVGQGYPRANAGIGVFGGGRAVTADIDKMIAARTAKTPADPLKYKYGDWFKGPDGRWKFEISDEGSALGDAINPMMQKHLEVAALPLDFVLQHKDLYDAYPAMKNTRVLIRPMADNLGGWFSMEGGPTIGINSKLLANPDQFQSVLLHEIQHQIQNIEGFAEGMYTKHPAIQELKQSHPAWEELTRIDEGLMNIAQQAQKKRVDVTKHPLFQELTQRQKALEKEINDYGYNVYRREMGESESRNVQERWAHGTGRTTPTGDLVEIDKVLNNWAEAPERWYHWGGRAPHPNETFDVHPSRQLRLDKATGKFVTMTGEPGK